MCVFSTLTFTHRSPADFSGEVRVATISVHVVADSGVIAVPITVPAAPASTPSSVACEPLDIDAGGIVVCTLQPKDDNHNPTTALGSAFTVAALNQIDDTPLGSLSALTPVGTYSSHFHFTYTAPAQVSSTQRIVEIKLLVDDTPLITAHA